MLELIAGNILLSILWLVSCFGDYLNFLYIWQLKEYRQDRFVDFSKSKQGKAFWFSYSIFWRSLIAVAVLFVFFGQDELVKMILIVIFGIDAARFAKGIFSKKFRRPDFTKKSLTILGIAVLIEEFIIFASHDWNSFYLMLVLRFLLLSAIVLSMTTPTRMLKKIYKILATQKMAKLPSVIVIGITGSYGKSSVKYFLSSILSSKYKVAYTPGNINTDIGVAQYILKHDFKNIDIFIVEMGAYRTGEIRSICKIVEPNIGILTAINEQHLSLFGDIKTTQEAKYELLRSLGPNDLAIVNIDNKYCIEHLDQLVCKKMTFGADELSKPSCQIKAIKQTDEILACDFVLDSGAWPIKTHLLGEHNCFNLAPCILVAKYFGLTHEQVASAVKELRNIKGKLQISEFGNSIIIDDSANSNPEGFLAALAVLRTFSSSRRRIVITRGMLELGSRSTSLHEQIGEEISISTDELIIINNDSAEALQKGVGTRYKTEVKRIYDVNKLVDYIRQIKLDGVVILLENRIPTQLSLEIFGHV